MKFWSQYNDIFSTHFIIKDINITLTKVYTVMRTRKEEKMIPKLKEEPSNFMHTQTLSIQTGLQLVCSPTSMFKLQMALRK